MEKSKILALILGILTLTMGVILFVSVVSSPLFWHQNKTQTQKPNFTAKNVTIIGDSITFLSTKTLLKNIDGLKAKNINAVGGRTWEQAVEIAKNIKLQPTVVFALGTNSPNLTRMNIDDAINTIGKNRKIVFVTNFTLENSYKNNNSLLTEYAKNYSNIYLADWAHAVKDKANKYLTPDPIHPNEKGMRVFTDTIEKTLKKIN